MLKFVLSKLHFVFALKKLGDLEYFFGIEENIFLMVLFFFLKKNISVSRLTKAGMLVAKGISTPLQECLNGPEYIDDLALYRAIIGALQYITLTRPEIVHNVNKFFRFMSQPLLQHWKVGKCILHYLKALSLMVYIQSASTHDRYNLITCCDADGASNIDDRRSTSCACIFFWNYLVS